MIQSNINLIHTLMDFFKDFKVSKPEFNLLQPGEHVVRIIRAEEITSFQQFNGEEKPKLPAWKDATPQLAITVVSAEEGKSGGLTHRFNGRGYVKYDELSDEQKASGEWEDHGGYACSLNDDDILVREESEADTKDCANIINQFASSLGIKEGTKLGKGIAIAIAEQTKFRVTVVNEPYKGKDQLRLSRFKAYVTDSVTADMKD
jgi:hypothetical protein